MSDGRAPGETIALLLPDLGGGGAERVTLNLAAAFRDSGQPVELVLLSPEGRLAPAVPPDLPVRVLGSGKLPAIFRLAGFLRRHRPAALLSSMASMNCVAVLAHRMARAPTRIVLAEHSTLSAEVARDWYRRMLPPAMRRLYPRADGVVAVSEGVAADLSARTGLPRDAIQVIYNPVIGPDFASRVSEVPAHPWLSDGGPPVVLGVGRLAPQKDFLTLIRAIARLEAPARLLILGEGPDRARLEAEIAKLDLVHRVALPGFVDNPVSAMRASAVFALSSRWEGLPTVLIEAVATGTPVVATDCPSGPREILAGRSGELVPVGNPEALAAALGRALGTPRGTPPDMTPFTAETARAAYARLLLGA
ncbi:MAG: glycosyltransferase [Paracoccaceae bacterium]